MTNLNLNEIIEFSNKIALIASTLFTIYKFHSSQSTKYKKIDLTKLDVESCNFLTGPLKEFYKEEQRRSLFYKYSDIDVSSEQQILIKELSLRLNNKFSWVQLKMASKYFKYNDDMITISIEKKEVMEARGLLIMSIILATLSFLLMYLSLFGSKTTIQSVITAFVIGIISIIYIAFFTQKFITPVYLAQCIEKQLKIINNKHNA